LAAVLFDGLFSDRALAKGQDFWFFRAAGVILPRSSFILASKGGDTPI
jgi:hypothetical protein